MATLEMVSENFLVFLVSCITCAVCLLVLSAAFGSGLILGNSQIAGSMSAVLLGLILNLIIFGVSKALLVISFGKFLRTQIFAKIFVIFITVWFFATFVPILGLEITHVWIGLITAIVVVACQYFTYIAALKILSKDF